MRYGESREDVNSLFLGYHQVGLAMEPSSLSQMGRGHEKKDMGINPIRCIDFVLRAFFQGKWDERI